MKFNLKKNTLGRLYKDGETIIKQGEEGDCVYVIQEGKVEILDESENQEIRIAELGQAEFFGEMGLFEKDVRSCTVRALGDAKVMTIDKRKLLFRSFRKDPSIAYRLLEKMSQRLRETNKKLLINQNKD